MEVATARVKELVFWNNNTLGKPAIVLIAGKMRVGKTTTAKIINSILFGRGFTASVESIAKFVKDSALTCFDWDENKDDRGRRLLQDVGRTGRAYDQDIWIRKLFDYLDLNYLLLPDFILIDDWRYTNELDWLKDRLYTVLTMMIVSNVRGKDSDDESEHDLDKFEEFDFVQQNDSDTVESYYTQLKQFVNNILLKDNKF